MNNIDLNAINKFNSDFNVDNREKLLRRKLQLLLKQKEFAVEKEDDNTNALEKSIPKTSKAV